MTSILRLSPAMIKYMAAGGTEQATDFSAAVTAADEHLETEHDISREVFPEELTKLLKSQAERAGCSAVSMIHLGNYAELAAMAIIGQVGHEDADAVQGLWECFSASVAFHLGIRLHEEHLKAAGEPTDDLRAEPTPTRH